MSTYLGSHYSTLTACARAWAETAAPDLSVFGAGDSPASEAHALLRFWDEEAVRSQGVVDLPTDRDEAAIDIDRWTELRLVALEQRIADGRKALFYAVEVES